MRCFAFILLLALLPRMAMAIPVGNMLCWGDDHLAYDSTECHSDASAEGCETIGLATAPASEGEPCIDIASVPLTASRGSVASVILHAPLVALLPVVTELPAPGARAAQSDARDDPPRFCARAFACLISPRR